MPVGKGTKRTAAERARISEGTRRGQRRWLRGLGVQPAHVRRFIATNHVSASLRPLLTEAVRETGDLIEQLGGSPSAAQRALLSSWTAQRTAALASFERWLQTSSDPALAAVGTHGNACARILAQLGLSGAQDTEDAALASYRAALRGQTIDRGPGTGADTPAFCSASAEFPRPAVMSPNGERR